MDIIEKCRSARAERHGTFVVFQRLRDLKEHLRQFHLGPVTVAEVALIPTVEASDGAADEPS